MLTCSGHSASIATGKIATSDTTSEVLNTLIELDDAASVALLYDIPGVTISARCGVAMLTNNGELLMELGKLLGDIQHDHCMQAILGDLARARAVIAYLQPYEDAAKSAA